MGSDDRSTICSITHCQILFMIHAVAKTPEELKAWRETLTTKEKTRKVVKKVSKIVAGATGCAIVAMAFVIGMQVDHLRTPIVVNFQTPVIWRSVPKPTPIKKAFLIPALVPQVMAEAITSPVPLGSIVNNIKMDSEQRQNAELIREAFPQDAQRMIAIAMAESGLRCGAVNHQDSNGVQAVGLFQINDGRLFNAEDIANLTDCRYNIERAKQKYRSQGLTAWGAFTSGAFYKYL